AGVSFIQAGHVVITPDSPRGPARRMSAGIVQLASRSGRAIVPTAYLATNTGGLPAIGRR
ncbi:MAG TPA: hypothetical protein VFB96_10560, partial [Pirellulaceae bacterium]|nr:hypothetical protein [Pirellulaceae bacterium]